jgi:uncharacterized protein
MKANRMALITGASSGLGMCFAHRFARMGYDLIITGRRKDKLGLLAEELQNLYGISVQHILAELSDEKDVGKIISVVEKNENMMVLVNNAGYGSGQKFCSVDIETNLQMLQVHVIASLKLIHAVLPHMISRREGIIINISSLGAFTPAPGSSMYSATKLFLKSFTESLHLEVSGSGIKLQCLCPGFTHTDFHNRRASGDVGISGGILWMDAESVVEECLTALEKGKVVCIPGLVNRIMLRIVSLIPRAIYYSLMMKMADKKNRLTTPDTKASPNPQPAS